jgi:hypothetical protein
METNLCRIFIDCLEWKWISTGSALLPYSENESVQDLHCLFGVDRSCAWYLLLVWSGNGSMVDLYCLFGVETNMCRIRTACLECKWICAGYLLLVYVCIGVVDSVILFNPCILCACHKLRPGFSTSHAVVVYIVFNELKWEVVVSFVDIYGIVYHHCLQLPFKIVRQKYSLIYNSISWR